MYQRQTSLADLAQAGIGGASLSSGGVSTEINLDSNQFRQILKQAWLILMTRLC